MSNETNRRKELLEYVKRQHGAQTRKYTGEPYWKHLVNVAEKAAHTSPLAYEIGLCHDLFEDTTCNYHELHLELTLYGYSNLEVDEICLGTIALTDKYTHEKYPNLNRQERKTLEAYRLSKIKPQYQSVKYADLIDNSSSIVERDPNFSKTYIPEKEAILYIMNQGDSNLYKEARSICLNYFLKY